MNYNKFDFIYYPLKCVKVMKKILFFISFFNKKKLKN